MLIKKIFATTFFCLSFSLVVMATSRTIQLNEPSTITNSGTYILTRNITGYMNSGSEFDIQADDVTIDLNGFTITADIRDTCIYQTNIYSHLTIKNGTIYNYNGVGFNHNAGKGYAVSALGSYTTLENITVIDCGNGFNLGHHAVVKKCSIIDSGNTNLFYGIRCKDNAVIENCILYKNYVGSGVGLEAGSGSHLENITCTENYGLETGIVVSANSIVKDIVIAKNNSTGNFCGLASGGKGERVTVYDNSLKDGSGISGGALLHNASVYKNSPTGEFRAVENGESYASVFETGDIYDSVVVADGGTFSSGYAFLSVNGKTKGCVAVGGSAAIKGFSTEQSSYCLVRYCEDGFSGDAKYCLVDNNTGVGFGLPHNAIYCHVSDSVVGYKAYENYFGFTKGCSGSGNSTNFITFSSSLGSSWYGEILTDPGENFVDDNPIANFEF